MSQIFSPDSKLVSSDGYANQRTKIWLDQVTDLQIKSGSGSPEGVIDGLETMMYMDTAGTTGSILYIKRDADIGGDTTQGWILV